AAARNDPDANPRLKITLELTTLTLPPVDKAPHVVYEKGKPSGKPLKRLHSVDTSEYSLVDARNPFHVWREKPVEVTGAQTDKVEVQQKKDDKPPPPPPVDPRKGADKLVLTATIAFDNQPIAYVRDDGKLTDPPRQIGLNEPFDPDGSK